MRSDTIDTRFDGNALAGAVGYFSYLPQVSLPSGQYEYPMAIADMADFFGVTHRTLHFYEEKGLIAARRSGAMRVYDKEQIQRMAVINACREIGIPIAVIQDLIEELKGATSQQEADELFHATLARRKRELTADVSHIHRQVQQIETLLRADTDEDLAKADASTPALSERERQCLTLMTEGYSEPHLASALNLELQALRDIEKSIIGKLEATNRFQAIAKAVLLGIVSN